MHRRLLRQHPFREVEPFLEPHHAVLERLDIGLLFLESPLELGDPARAGPFGMMIPSCSAAGPSIAAAMPGSPKMPDPTMQLMAEQPSPPTPITM